MLRRAGALLVVGLLAGSVVLALVRWLGPGWHWAVLLASFGFAGVAGFALASLGSLTLLRRARRRTPWVVALVVALAGTGVQVAWLAPAYVADRQAGEASLRVLTANLRFGEADPDALAALLRREDPDLAVLTEATPSLVAELARRGLGTPDGALPHVGGRPLPAAAGTVVLSRHPLRDEVPVPLGNRGYRMTVAAPEPFTLSAVHAAYPLQSAEPWRRDLGVVAADAAQVEGPHVVVGDLNATADHRAFREVLDEGLRDAAEQSGAGWQPTWPVPGERPVLGLSVPTTVLALDHVLVSPELHAVATRVHRLPGTDHEVLVADVGRVGRPMACCATPETRVRGVAEAQETPGMSALRRLATTRLGRRSPRPAVCRHGLARTL